jgi:hypothetical protein
MSSDVAGRTTTRYYVGCKISFLKRLLPALAKNKGAVPEGSTPVYTAEKSRKHSTMNPVSTATQHVTVAPCFTPWLHSPAAFCHRT